MIWIPLGIACVLGLVGPATLPARAGADSTGLAVLRGAFVAAYNAGLVGPLESLYTSDAVRLPYDAVTQVGRTAIVEGFRVSFGRRTHDPELALSVVDLRVVNGLAIERGTYHEVLRPRGAGRTLVEDGKYVSVARRNPSGNWQYFWSIFNRDGPAKPVVAPAAGGSAAPAIPLREGP